MRPHPRIGYPFLGQRLVPRQTDKQRLLADPVDSENSAPVVPDAGNAFPVCVIDARAVVVGRKKPEHALLNREVQDVVDRLKDVSDRYACRAFLCVNGDEPWESIVARDEHEWHRGRSGIRHTGWVLIEPLGLMAVNHNG